MAPWALPAANVTVVPVGVELGVPPVEGGLDMVVPPVGWEIVPPVE
jgi:hypothetical protein